MCCAGLRAKALTEKKILSAALKALPPKIEFPSKRKNRYSFCKALWRGLKPRPCKTKPQIFKTK
jgi:hypothetical protein